jgi:hypothetical protein
MQPYVVLQQILPIPEHVIILLCSIYCPNASYKCKKTTEFYASFPCVFCAGKKGAVNVMGNSSIKFFKF